MRDTGHRMKETGGKMQESGIISPWAGGELTDQSTRNSSVKRQLIAPIDMNA
ncbi:MAG: hypothetical protein HUU43_00765 [Ignavibacteriaceae bacterium]|nr:hypothetical protein [Ignavibacteriaceae bacterium]